MTRAALALPLLLAACLGRSPEGPPAADPESLPEGCTSIMVGRLASVDGSVMTSHTCDGNYRTWLRMEPARRHPEGARAPVHRGRMHTEFPGDLRGVQTTGEIPQAAETHAFLDTAYPCLNEHQLAMGESTFGGRPELQSDAGIFYVEELQRLALERCRTAREAVLLIGRLAEEHGYADQGEALTLADPEEVWHLEIVGPGKGAKGALWAAVRIPDDHVGVAANVSRIGTLDLARPDRCLASAGVERVAVERKWWDPAAGKPFRFWEAYGGVKPFTVRELWVFRSLAPSLGLSLDDPELPFSIQPERKVDVREVFALLRATYEGSEFDLARNLRIADPRTKEERKSIYAHPWLGRDQQALFNALKPGTVRFQRPIAVIFNAYHTVIQCRSWLPGPIGGICWLGFDNPATTPRMPIFAGVTSLPADLEVDSQHRFRTDSASWAFRRASRLATIQWGAHRERVQRLMAELEEESLAQLPGVERQALALYPDSPAKAREVLTRWTASRLRAAVHAYWELGDQLWLAYRQRL